MSQVTSCLKTSDDFENLTRAELLSAAAPLPFIASCFILLSAARPSRMALSGTPMAMRFASFSCRTRLT